MLSRILYTTLILLSSLLLLPGKASAQCTNAQLNWDNLDYYWNSGGSSNTPYGTYITDAMEQSQRFGMGPITVTIATNNVNMIQPGAGVSAENTLHTGDVSADYSGADVQYNPSANGYTITITFSTPVTAPHFTLYDIDDDASFTVTATNNLNVATAVNVTTYASTILTVGIVPLIRTVAANNTALATNLNRGTATFNIPGLVRTITINCTARGDDPVFWMSDINACVPGTFTTNWHQNANNRPFWGPTQSQADYFLVTPDNNSTYMVNPATGETRVLFTDPAKTYVNSFAYDPYNRYLYYITENPSVNANNKELKRYDYNTETYSTLVANITTTLGIPTFNMGVESAGAAFYDGCLYFGVEGGTMGSGSSLRSRETIIWRINFDGSQNPVSACQVFAAPAATDGSGSTSTHDWGDFIVKNGVIYDFNTARNGSGTPNYSQSKYHHFNMWTGQAVIHNNPGTTSWNGQAAMGWSQQLYFFRDGSGTNSVVGQYNEAGVNGATTNLYVTSGPAWPGGAGDASDPIRPKCDFGDAPASYDPYVTPATQSPAVHERPDSMWLGVSTTQSVSWNNEYLKRGVNGTADSDDGIATVHFLQPGTSDYLVQVSFYNNSSGNARIMAWLDYNGNGVFDASEAGQVLASSTLTPSASIQTRYLYWPDITTPLTNGSFTYLRVRITSAAAGMTSSHATGFFLKGEVEDYRVQVDDYPLAAQLLSFDAVVNNDAVKVTWKIADEASVYSYEVERSQDNVNWSVVETVQTVGTPGAHTYNYADINPLKGDSYYRLRIIESTGLNRFSAVRKVTINPPAMSVKISPNPATTSTTLKLESQSEGEVHMRLVNMQGRTVLSNMFRVQQGSNKLELQIPATLSEGTYILRLIKGEEILQEKLIINR